MKLELIHEAPKCQPHVTPLLFVHGKWHAAWCWAEHFLPYFAEHGYISYALSLRGHGESEGQEHLRRASIADYVADVAQTAGQMNTPPVIIGHSMGGYITQKYLETHSAPAAVLLTAVPPYGLWPPLWQVFRRHPRLVMESLFTLRFYPVVKTPALAGEFLFSAELPAEKVAAYQRSLQDESFRAGLDELGLNLVHPKRVRTPLLVIGAQNDTFILPRHIRATARAYGTNAVFFANMAHDVMLEEGWQGVAERILEFLKERGLNVNLDDLQLMHQLDSQNMLGEIDDLPAQLEKVWELGQTQPFPLSDGPNSSASIRQVVIAGMGGSAIGADLLAAYIAPSCPVPVIVKRDYGLPAWARGPETLVITSSHSGNTEETLDAFNTALQNECRLMAIATGGKLAERAGEAKIPLWKFEHRGQPRAAAGFSFGLLLAVFARLGLIPNPAEELAGAVKAMKKQQETLRAEVPVTQNPAKRLAGQLVGRWMNVYASGCLAPVARRWKGQVNEIAKAGAGFEIIPEADHNALAGLLNPADVLSCTMTLFLCAPSDHPRNRLRLDLTRQGFMLEGLNTDVYEAQGETALAHIWTALHFGDYTAYYLAMAYGADPTAVEALENLKAAMQAAR